MRFKPRGPTTFLTEFQTLAPVLVSAKETKQVITRTGDIIRLRIVLHMDTTNITEIDNICPLIVWYSYQVRKTFGIRRLRARWNFCVQLCRKTALPGNETVMGVNFNTFLTFWADMRRLRCFCLCVTGFEKLCTRYRPRDSVIACQPCVIIVLRGTLARTPPNICDLASVLPVLVTWDLGE